MYQRDVGREARIPRGRSRRVRARPSPVLWAMDLVGQAVGRPCFAMELVPGRSPDDSRAGRLPRRPAAPRRRPGHAAAPRGSPSTTRSRHCTTVESGAQVPEAVLGDHGSSPWKHAVSAIGAPPARSRGGQRRPPAATRCSTGWRRTCRPTADDDPAVCMGDAGIVNCLFEGSERRALVDSEESPAWGPLPRTWATTASSTSSSGPPPRRRCRAWGRPTRHGRQQWAAATSSDGSRPGLLDRVRCHGAVRDGQPGHGAVGDGRPLPSSPATRWSPRGKRR